MLTRLRWFGPLLLLLGALASLIASRMVWIDSGGLDVLGATATSNQIPALGYVVVPLSGLLAMFKTIGKRVIGGLAIALGVAIASVPFRLNTNPPIGGGDAIFYHPAPQTIVLIAGALVIAGGALCMLCAASWPTRKPPAWESRPETDPWKAMDAGIDPTAEHDNLAVDEREAASRQEGADDGPR